MLGLIKGRVELVPQCCNTGPVSMFKDVEQLMSAFHPMFAFEDDDRPVAKNARMAMVDLREEKDRYVVQADLPGMAKEDVSIEMDDETLHISACKEQASEEKEEGYIRKERGSLCFFRQVPLPNDVDRENVKARIENGVLEVSLPKAQATEERRTKIAVE
ncbi:MAG: Hsp20/alpha crystallin family protein [Methanomassiliicoccales archaeon]|nr:Hsp20/alpha crystallin family protein [Methanomassiliicoccales archaeon]